MSLQDISLPRNSWHHLNVQQQGIKTPKFSFTFKNFQVKTVTTPNELMQVFHLRHKVFGSEMGGKDAYGFDYDYFDDFAEILIIKDVSRNQIVGTYRLISNQDSDEFYSGSEFDFFDFKENASNKLELSRACIAKEYRTGIVLGLLWRGITGYASMRGARYLFGCCSVFTMNAEIIKGIWEILQQNNQIGYEFSASPNISHRIDNFSNVNAALPDLAKAEIPALMRVYLKAGAKIYGEPAIDEDFRCMDFFMVLDLANIHNDFKRKYS